MYCFDTDVIAAALSADPPIHLVRRLARTPAGEQCTTSVTVSELAYAASRAGRPDLVERLADTVLAAQTVLPFDEAAAAIYGRAAPSSSRSERGWTSPACGSRRSRSRTI